jgi:hypothetical protein
MPLPLLFGPYGRNAIEVIDRLAGAGANAVWFHGFDAGAFDACAKAGIAACVEFKTFRADFGEHPELVPTGVDGKPIRYGRLVQGVCLSQKDFLDETEANLRAGLNSFQPVGVWLDYLTYAGWFEVPEPDLQESCFCAACIADFCEATGVDATTPAQILETAQAEWTRHKCIRVARFALHYADIIRTFAPGCMVGAYMCPWTPVEFDGALARIFAQDYDLFAPAIDVYTPLIYGEKSGRDAHWGGQLLEQATEFMPSGRKMQLILDYLDFPASLQAVADSPVPSWGIQLFAGAPVFADAEQSRIFSSAVEKIRGRIETQVSH